LGTRLVKAIIALAQARDIARVLTLTRATALFEGLGFRRAPVTDFPAKVLTDCAPCPLKQVCDEIALVLHLSDPPGPEPPPTPFYNAAGGHHEGL
jgi:N-acetylglutamate synthase-like GNAT family acetyltransferase